MSFRPGSRLPRGEWIAFGLLLMLSVGMMGLSGTRLAGTLQTNVNLILNPVESWVNDAADTAGQYWTTLTQLDSIRQENDRLRQENRTLKEELERSESVAVLNRDWTKVAQTQQDSQYKTVIARVVVRDITDVRPKELIVDRGKVDGVSLGQVVMDDGGALVGRVIEVQSYNATILLLNDNSATVVGQEAKSGATGTVKGQIGGLLQMQYVNATDTLTKGQAVVTSGTVLLNGNVRSPYPPGLLIGTIISVSSDPNEVVQSAVIQPAADLAGARWVLIIMSYQGGFFTPGPSLSPSPSPTTTQTPGPKPTPSPGPTPAPSVTPPGLSTPPPY